MNFKDESNIIEYLKFRKEVWKKYHRHLSRLLKTNYKKAVIMTYWLNDYLKYICKEKTFKPSQNINYKKGQIVKVHFGYRIGSEIGGPHYAVVLDANSYRNNGTITVIPLKSKRNKRTQYSDKYHLDLGGVFRDLLYRKVSDSAVITTRQLINAIEQAKSSNGDNIETMEATFAQLRKRQGFETEILEFSDALSESSVADIGQITTISKIRIIHPTKNRHVLAGVTLPPDVMARINNKVKELYLSDSIN